MDGGSYEERVCGMEINMRRTKRWFVAAICAAMVTTAFAGCQKEVTNTDLDPDAVVLTVDEETVSLQEAYFMMKWQQAQYQAMASSIYGTEWYNQDLEGNGETFLDYIKSTIMDLLENMCICKQYAKENGISLTENEEKAVEDAVDAFMNANTAEAEAAMMADEETVRQVLINYTIYNKVFNEVVKDADTSVTEEEARQRTYSYIYQDLVTTDEDGNKVDMEKSTINDYYYKFAEIKAAAEKSGDFDQAAEDGGYSVASHTYHSGDEEDTFVDINSIADTLTVGQVSALIPVEGGLALIHLDTDNDTAKTEAARQTKANEKQAAHYEEWAAPRKEAANIEVDEDLWGKIGFEKALQAVTEE